MNKIKIVGILVFVLSLLLAVLSSSISKTNSSNSEILDTLNEQKAFTQEISKNIFYIYKNKNASIEKLDKSINRFISNINEKNEKLAQVSSLDIRKENEKILLLWNEFYLFVQKFRDKSKITSTYSNIILEDIVNKIYNINLDLVIEFNKLIKMHQDHFIEKQKESKNIQYLLFTLLIGLLIYLFTQVKIVITFVQKFLNTSKSIIKNSSIKDLECIEVEKNSGEVLEATRNFNYLVKKINDSIEFSSKSIENSHKSLEVCEKNIEELLELLHEMHEDEDIDNELTKKEDALILSLEELSNSEKNLKNLKNDLDRLISHKNI